MSHLDESAAERAASVKRFLEVSGRWRLEIDEIRGLLGIGGTEPIEIHGFDLALALQYLGPDQERRMRLLVEVDWLLPAMIGEEDAGDWLRTADVVVLGGSVPPVTPIEALSSGGAAILGLRNHLQDLAANATGEREF